MWNPLAVLSSEKDFSKPLIGNRIANAAGLHVARIMTADGLDTAMMVLGSERGIALARRCEVDVMFLDVNSAGELVETSIGVFSDPE